MHNEHAFLIAKAHQMKNHVQRFVFQSIANALSFEMELVEAGLLISVDEKPEFDGAFFYTITRKDDPNFIVCIRCDEVSVKDLEDRIYNLFK